MEEGRWNEITRSEHPWEREALAFLRERLPDHEPYRVWANFADSGTRFQIRGQQIRGQYIELAFIGRPGRLLPTA